MTSIFSEISPIFNALRRSKAGAMMLLFQIAITTAIVSNAAFIIQERMTYLNQDTGYPEQEIFLFSFRSFAEDINLMDWMGQWRQEGDDEQVIRSFLGRMLFSQDDIKKSVQVLSGGEQGRMLLGKLMMHKPNMLLMDEPTNHMDMESIESLNMALEQYEGTLFFVSHDREFVSSLANRIIEIKDGEIVDFRGSYEEYLASKGISS